MTGQKFDFENFFIMTIDFHNCYVSDIFEKFEKIQHNMLKDTIEGFTEKIHIWKNRIKNSYLEMFRPSDHFFN